MAYGFDTDDPDLGAAAMLVYAVYRSRDRQRFKITPDVWGQIERAVKSGAKRAGTTGEFLEKLMPKLQCRSIRGNLQLASVVTQYSNPHGEIMETRTDGQRTFLTDVLALPPHPILRALYRESAHVVLLVRARLEEEKPVEALIERDTDVATDLGGDDIVLHGEVLG
jgi:hypothetical protein